MQAPQEAESEGLVKPGAVPLPMPAVSMVVLAGAYPTDPTYRQVVRHEFMSERVQTASSRGARSEYYPGVRWGRRPDELGYEIYRQGPAGDFVEKLGDGRRKGH